MAKKQRSYTDHFRREAVRLMETSGKPVAQLARDLGVNENALYRWRRRFGSGQRKHQQEQPAVWTYLKPS
jgi:transposase